MSRLNGNFDVINTEGTPLAHAALAEVLDVVGGAQVDTSGTPVAGLIPPGAIVKMDANGEAEWGAGVDSPDLAAASPAGDPVLFFIAIDGNTDLAGSFTGKLSCLQGGFKCATDQFKAEADLVGPAVAYVPGMNLIVVDSIWQPAYEDGAAETLQHYGVVAKEAVKDGLLHVLVPQGQATKLASA